MTVFIMIGQPRSVALYVSGM